MAVTALDIEGLFTSPVHASAGAADRVSVRQLAPLTDQEIPQGFAGWVEKRQREYRAGRHHARAALRDAGCAEAEIPRGMDGLPQFPPEFSGSITHTGHSKTFAAAAVCRGPTQIGLDAEFLRPLAEGMVELILTPGERALGLSGNSDGAPYHPLLAFSAKEAFYKCVYPRCRQRLGFHDARVWLRSAENAFTVALENRPSAELPEHLEGRYLIKEGLIISAVTWPA